MSIAFTPLVSLSVSTRASAPTPYAPADDSVAVEIYLTGMRKAQLKKKFGWGSGLPELPREGCAPERLAQADALRALALRAESERDRRTLEKKARRLEMCGRLGELFECPECLRAYKRGWGCSLRSCWLCGKNIFDRAFAELLPLESHVPSSLASLPGFGWKILDYSFYHDGDFPTRKEMRLMRAVVNRVTDRAVREKCSEMYRAGIGCRLRYEDGQPMMFDGWPVASAPDGSARVLMGWTVVRVGRIGKRPTCILCGSRVKKVRGENARLCPKCGPVLWPDWENLETDSRRWRLRFGVLHIPVSEFGFDSTNYHFHTCFFGPYLEQARLVEIFREESLRTLGVESRGVWIETAKRGYRSALAHALKYTAKMPGSTPERLAEYEKVLVGVRRYAVRGFLQGVALEHEKRGEPNCPECKKPLRRISGLGLVPLSEIEDIPFLPGEEPVHRADYKGDEFRFSEPKEMAAHPPRAPC
jgi:predicted RNA-binding Zn-ribbon protein involved in translation (DUF1610 family)